MSFPTITLPQSEYNRRMERFMAGYAPLMAQYNAGAMNREQARSMYDVLAAQFFYTPTTEPREVREAHHPKHFALRTIYDETGNVYIDDLANGSYIRMRRQPDGTYYTEGDIDNMDLTTLIGGRAQLGYFFENAHSRKFYDL